MHKSSDFVIPNLRFPSVGSDRWKSPHEDIAVGQTDKQTDGQTNMQKTTIE